MPDLAPLTTAVTAGNREVAKRLTQDALAAQTPLTEVLAALIAAMADIGAKFQCREAFVPEMLMAARAMKEAMTVLEPRLVQAGIHPEHKALIGTVQGDLHDIGKNLVAMLWKGANFDVIDLGTNVPPAKFASAVQKHRPEIVGLSALLTTTMPAMQETLAAIKNAGVPVRIIVGGAPVTREFAQKIGADGYASDATSAVALVRSLCEAPRPLVQGGIA